MRATKRKIESNQIPITWSRQEYIAHMGCGNSTADKIAEQAQAKIRVGKRVLINVEKIKKYLNEISEVE